MQEIDPLLETFGLKMEFDQKWLDVQHHDISNDLPYEWQTKGYIHSWETRAKKEVMKLQDKETTILDSVTSYILNHYSHILKYSKNPYDIIGNAFIEGTKGLYLSSDDLNKLMVA